MSYIVGWLCVLGWQTCSASAAYVAGTQIQGLLVLNYPDSYVYEAWHGTLLTIAVTVFSATFNTFLARKLPMIEAVILIIHVFAFFGILVPLWVLAPRASAKDVFTDFSDGGGWGNLGLSALVGFNGGISECFAKRFPPMGHKRKNCSTNSHPQSATHWGRLSCSHVRRDSRCWEKYPTQHDLDDCGEWSPRLVACILTSSILSRVPD